MKRIAFFAYESRDLNTFPAITNAMKLLTEAGCEIDIFLPDKMATSLSMPGLTVIISSPNSQHLYIKESVRRIRKSGIRYDLFFAYHIEGLVIAYLINQKVHVPTIYYSMELVYNNYALRLLSELNKLLNIKTFAMGFIGRLFYTRLPGDGILGHIKNAADSLSSIPRSILMIYYYYALCLKGDKFIPYAIIQDRMRAAILHLEFSFIKDIFLVPNSYMGYDPGSSTFAYDHFTIPPGKKIILYTGGVENNFFDSDLLRFIDDLSDDYIVFMNAFSRDNHMDTVLQQYNPLIEKGRLFINRKNLSEHNYTLLVKSSSIGLAWYREAVVDDANMFYLGLSSGKLTKFLSCGKPVIAPRYCIGFQDLIDKNQLGITCSSFHDINTSIRYIENNYAELLKNISKYYQEHLEYKKCFSPVLQTIHEILGEDADNTNSW
mgnify:CR=1 FL=1